MSTQIIMYKTFDKKTKLKQKIHEYKFIVVYVQH